MFSIPVRTSRLGSGLALGIAVGATAPAGAVVVTYDEPSLDRWFYPFNPTPGTRGSSSTFATYQEPDFDNRDAQMIVGFDTAADVTPGLGFSGYDVVSARLTMQTAIDLSFIYDDTQDSYVVLLPSDDPDYVAGDDPGQPVELFGLGFRNGFTSAGFAENTPYSFAGPLGRQIRNAYAIDFDAGGAPIDVSLSVEERFDPQPWAIGTISTVSPGAFVPEGTDMVFDLDVSNPHVAGYLRSAMNEGRLLLCATSLTVVVQQGGEFPSFFNRENTLVQFGVASAARLELDVVAAADPCQADIDDSGDVGFGDILSIIGNWGVCIGCLEDLNADGDVGFADILEVIGAWGSCP